LKQADKWRLSGFVGAEIAAYARYVLANGHVSIERGYIEGRLTLASFTEFRPESPDLLVVFDFLDENGQPWRHASVIRAGALFPPTGSEVALVRKEPERGLCFETLLDDRDDYELLVPDDEPIRGRLKYTEARFWPRIDPKRQCVEMVLWFLCPGDPRGVQDHLTIRYPVPLERLLWRNAPIITEEELLPQSADHVFVAPLDEQLDDLTPSPIRITGGRSG